MVVLGGLRTRLRPLHRRLRHGLRHVRGEADSTRHLQDPAAVGSVTGSGEAFLRTCPLLWRCVRPFMSEVDISRFAHADTEFGAACTKHVSNSPSVHDLWTRIDVDCDAASCAYFPVRGWKAGGRAVVAVDPSRHAAADCSWCRHYRWTAAVLVHAIPNARGYNHGGSHVDWACDWWVSC